MRIWLIHDWYRFALHVPVGMAIYELCDQNIGAGISLAIYFLVYEIDEDGYLKDRAYIDIQGAIGGILLQAWLSRRKK